MGLEIHEWPRITGDLGVSDEQRDFFLVVT